MDIDLSEYIGEYCAELFEQLEELQSDLLELEQNPDNEEIINEIFRIAHTIKGSAATMGFADIAKVAHAFEDLLGEVRDKRISIDNEVFKTFLDAYDIIKSLADHVQAGTEPEGIDVSVVEKALRSFIEDQKQAPPAAPGREPEAVDVVDRLTGFTKEPPSDGRPEETLTAEIEKPPPRSGRGTPPSEKTWKIRMSFDPDVDMKSVRAFLVINHLRDIGDLLEINPSADDIEQDNFEDKLELTIRTATARPEIENILSFGEATEVEMTEETGLQTASPVPDPDPVPDPALTSATDMDAGASSSMEAKKQLQPADEEEFLKFLLGGPQEEEKKEPAGTAPPATAEVSTPDIRLVDELNEDHKNTVIESINQDLNVFEIVVLFRNAEPQSMLRALTVMNYLGEMCRIVVSLPRKKDLEEGVFDGRLQLIVSTEKEIAQLRELLLAEEIAKTSFTPITLDGLHIVPLEGDIPPSTRVEETASAILPQSRTSTKPQEDRKMAIPTVRVTVDRLDDLMNLVGELVIKKTRLNQVFSEFETSGDVEQLRLGIQELNQGLGRITSDLQAGIMKVRMVQIGQVFYRFSRLVRDLSKNLGKQVEFLIEGAETELDKTVIDEIGDPLMHLIRNCLDHGIEPPEVRRKLGKSEKGILLLRAQHAGNHIIVETADDGSGIDAERIKQTAIAKGLVDPLVAARLTPQEIHNFIFMPGFSTSGEVTNVSGRGVGMDVVKDSIEKLQGEIQIKSEKNVGTTIQIKLPLTLAIIQGLLVRVANETFTIPLSTVKETVTLDTASIHTIQNQKVVTIRDEVIPLINLQEFFGLPLRTEDNKFFIVLAGVDDNKVGLVVNYLYGRHEIVIKSLDRRFTSVRGFAGGTVLGDGTVSLILDIPVLVEESKRAYLASM